jgi:Protein of unknown function (DUF1553)/Protein of unknown function (DUF1549)/Concanavalin A-like lectin/glucanases superfamily/Planctomycete cytochrome C
MKSRWKIGRVFLVLLLASPSLRAGTPAYNRDIRPILSENCFPCHGADSAARKANLRLDRFEDAILPRKDSQPAIVPGKPQESAMVSRITATDPDDIMPPTKTHKFLTAEQKELLKQWIASGAKYQLHWSLIAPTRPKLPQVQNRRWVRNPIDAFILARLEKEGLSPAPEADRRTLARRVSLDLTGLPATPEEVRAFLEDQSPDAYEKLVDRLLASPHWGEHRARYWLDAARYADSNGIHIDNYREMWPYRDWVINAFNRNERFDQFTVEQLAGDLLPNRTLEQQIASGFNRCNITTSEGGAIDDEYYVLYTRDRTETTSQVWLGLTAGCAVCHDHKYDRLSQKEFYSMSAFFNNTTQKAMDGNVKDTPPVIVVPARADRPRWDALAAQKKNAKKRVERRRDTAQEEYQAWLATASPEVFLRALPPGEPELQALLADDQGQDLKVTVGGRERCLTLKTNAGWQEGAVAANAFTTSAKTTAEIPDVGDFDRDQGFSFAAWVRLGKDKDGALFARMDDKNDFRGWDLWLEGGKPGTHIVSKWPEDALKVTSNKPLEPNRWTHVCITYDGSSKASGVKIYLDGKREETAAPNDKLEKTIRTKVPFKIGQRSNTSAVEGAGLQDVRVYARALSQEEVKGVIGGPRLAWLLAKPAASRSEIETDDLYKGWLTHADPAYQAANALLAGLEKEESEIKVRGSITHVMQEKDEAAIAFVLNRGEYTQRKDKVMASTPEALPPMPPSYPTNRLGFAKWLLLPEQPLTARVTVNRFWQEVFGTGIVKTAGDFGVTGDMPSHQELLDWLAVEFRESGWDMKRMFKQLVTSATYRQSAVMEPDKLAKDPQNRLLSRGPRFRMDAEIIRDTALAASGLLVEKIGGPSVKPYQPDGVWEAIAMDVSNTRFYKRDSGDKLYRRSLYTFWKRQAPPVTMEIFNAPNRETCTVRRERSDTPLQALATLNDTQFVEAARVLAQRSLREVCSTEEARLDFMAERLLSRPLRPEEMKIARASLNDLLASYKSAPDDAHKLLEVGESKVDESLAPPTLAAYTMVANELMNLDEVLNK